MPVLLLLFALLLGLGFIWALFASARNGHPSVELNANGMTFRHGMPLKVFSIVSLVGAEIAFATWAIMNPNDARRYAFPLIFASFTLGIAGFLLCWEAYRFALHVSPAGLDCRSPWTARRLEPWSSLQRVEFSTGNCWFIMHFEGGRAFRISALVPGVWRLLEEFEKRLKAEQLLGAESGYQLLGRRWPFRHHQKAKSPSAGLWIRRLALSAGLAILGFVGLFVFNGLLLADRENPICDRFENIEISVGSTPKNQITILTYNIAKAFAPRENLRFAEPAEVEARLDKISEIIKRQNPDLVFLSEAMTECSPSPINQVEYIARKCGLPFFAFGENYNVGLPFYRVVGGNAILSRRKLTPEKNISLVGRKPFFETTNSRRALFASLDIGGKRVWLGSLHNDSFDPANNLAQVQQILTLIDDRPCVLAGDFNATPDSESMRALKECGRFVGEWLGQPTFPAKKARLDYILGPGDWTHLKTAVLEGDASDHRAVVSVFRVDNSSP